MALCVLPGCRKHAFFDSISGKQHQCCGRTHHLMEMVRRNTGLLPNPPKSDGSCQLSGCTNQAVDGHDFCCKSHVLIAKQQPVARKCELHGCSLPVFVEQAADGTIKVHAYCGWSHAQESRLVLQTENLRLDVGSEEIVDCLAGWISESKTSRGINVDENFFKKHPWQIMPRAASTVTLIAPLKWKKSKRDNTTLEGYHWKQQGKQWPEVITFGNGRQVQIIKRNMSYIGDKPERCELKYSLVEYVILGHSDYGAFKLNSRPLEKATKIKVDAKPDKKRMRATDAILAEMPATIPAVVDYLDDVHVSSPDSAGF